MPAKRTLRRAAKTLGGGSAPEQAADADQPAAEPTPAATIRQRMRDADDPAVAARLAEVIGPSLSPVFLFAPPHGGGEAVRAALAQHPSVHAPAGLSLTGVSVGVSAAAEPALAALGVAAADLEHMLWDMLLRDQLARSGKRVLVVADPAAATEWSRIKEAWPGGRFVFVIRHPGEVLALAADATDSDAGPGTAALVKAVHKARMYLPGLTLRHEELADDAKAAAHRLFDYLEIEGSGEVVEALASYASSSDAKVSQPASMSDQLAEIARSWAYA